MQGGKRGVMGNTEMRQNLAQNVLFDTDYLEVRRRVEFLQQSEVRSEIGAISAGIIDFADRVFR